MQTGSSDIDALGKRLNLELDCSIRLPGFGREEFICTHEMTFPISDLRKSDDWSWAKKKHTEGVSRR